MKLLLEKEIARAPDVRRSHEALNCYEMRSSKHDDLRRWVYTFVQGKSRSIDESRTMLRESGMPGDAAP